MTRHYIIHDYDTMNTYVLPKSSKKYQYLEKKNEIISRIYHMQPSEDVVISHDLSIPSSNTLFKFIKRHIKENNFNLNAERSDNTFFITWRKPCQKTQ